MAKFVKAARFAKFCQPAFWKESRYELSKITVMLFLRNRWLPCCLIELYYTICYIVFRPILLSVYTLGKRHRLIRRGTVKCVHKCCLIHPT